ncbi:Flp family type IVb pilin [Dialister hominis]|jgi:Flp pilus assembly pilin Flp|uniref:Flp family type IVb pilin n=1 Tax=Dialister hominis TaxID=2582419 RepID=UPI003AEF5C17
MLQLIKEFRALWQCKYFGEKGQDLIEYALLLAIVVGIGYLIYTTSGLNANIQSIFTNASKVTSSAAAVAKSGATTTNGG